MLTLTTSWWPGNQCRTTKPLSETERYKLQWVLETLGFVMPKRGTFSGQEWIDTIRLIYDTNNPQIAEAIEIIERASQ